MQRTGAVALVEALKLHGVKHVFGYPGGAIMPTYDALVDAQFEHILARHEQGAGFEAIGYARSTGQVGVCIATSGPGATNLITALADAYLDSVPLVAITGQVATHLLGTDGFQEIDTLGLSLACTKHSFMIEDVDTIPYVVAQAFELAQSGRPGPVLIDIPRDIQLTPCAAQLVESKPKKAARQQTEKLKRAVEVLSEAKKPMLYVGGGAVLANAKESINALLDKLQIPVVSTLKGLGVVNPDYQYYLGMLGMHGVQPANHAVQECDLLIAVGARFDDRVTGNLKSFAVNASVIHIDIDAAEINKLRKATVSLCGDLMQAVEYLTQEAPKIDYITWQKRIVELKEQFELDYSLDETGTIQPVKLLHYVSEKAGKDAIITTDVGQHQMWVAQHMNHYDGLNLLTSAAAGTMGYGLPAAIGAKLANPYKQVICVSGDGSIMMNIQELVTAFRAKAPVKIVLIDNNQLGMVRQWQELFFDSRYSQTLLDCNPDFVALAKACHAQAESISCNSQVVAAVERMLESETSYLLHIKVPQSNVWPLVAPNTPNEDMLDQTSYKSNK